MLMMMVRRSSEDEGEARDPYNNSFNIWREEISIILMIVFNYENDENDDDEGENDNNYNNNNKNNNNNNDDNNDDDNNDYDDNDYDDNKNNNKDSVANVFTLCAATKHR